MAYQHKSTWSPDLKRRMAQVGAGDWDVAWALMRELAAAARSDGLLWVLGATSEQGWRDLWFWGAHRLMVCARADADPHALAHLYTLCIRVSAAQTALDAADGWRVGLHAIFALEALVQGDGCRPGQTAWSERAITDALLAVGPRAWWRLRVGMAEVLFNLAHGPLPSAILFNNLVRRYIHRYRHQRDETRGWRRMLRALLDEGFIVERGGLLDLGPALPPLPTLYLA